jgi:PhnB protein
MHSEIKVLNSVIFVVDDFPEWRGGKERHAKALGGTPVVLNFAVDDVDAVYERAVKTGCTSEMAPKDQFWGDRYAHVMDPFGHEWAFVTPLKDGPEAWPKMQFGADGGEEQSKKAKN